MLAAVATSTASPQLGRIDRFAAAPAAVQLGERGRARQAARVRREDARGGRAHGESGVGYGSAPGGRLPGHQPGNAGFTCVGS